jgi:hypothetical protein
VKSQAPFDTKERKRVALASGLDPKRKKEAEDRWLDGKDCDPCVVRVETNCGE